MNYFFAMQTKGNAVLQASLERRKKALHERRLALEQDVVSNTLVSFSFPFMFFFPKRTYVLHCTQSKRSECFSFAPSNALLLIEYH